MSEETYARLDSYAEDMSTCTLTNGDGIGYFYNRVDPDQPAGYTAVDMTTAAAQGFRDGAASKSEPCDGCFMADAEALRKDAERYRWTSIEGNWVARMFGKWRAHVGAYGDASPTEWYETREEAIDAAMSKEG